MIHTIIVGTATALTICSCSASANTVIQSIQPPSICTKIERPLSISTGICEYNGITLSFTGDSNIMSKKDSRLEVNLRKLSSFLSYPANWNGYGAVVINPELVELTSNILKVLPLQPEVFPLSNGGIQFEFDGPNQEYLEIEFSDLNKVNIFHIDSSGNESERAESIDKESIKRLVANFND